ncbi:syntaxin, Qa-SNARE family [Plasmodium gaboni]|uniref:Syntaxin, Qa-SNARE family n=1 Tax=Plasmodium gaboni TaxID=647221 RepID=A0A151LH00_9APIC|nr:syntaxin, Qa-SNARE family [Plasmodium gaboni]XP_028539589.1 syntaxin, Qa-SNARE family [Plasmodium sp. gorilla clade G2]KYN98213.1 syntaxin, Qa-SNARE family [Plasmodium gaboni]SOV16678.1 syntaxin, Qa-SNARE family [Plasmodium gaboni]SOV17072.1 syntaxin, Qa-SNARE family [Plasmodium sp. gorilla clade G2]
MEVIYRNITNTYFDYRREIKKKKNRFKLRAYEKVDEDEDTGKENLLNQNEDLEMQEQSMLPPYWIEKIEECSEDINNMKTKIIQLQKLQKNKLLNALNNDESLTENITQLSSNITFLIKNCEQKIQSVSSKDYDKDKNNIIEKLKNNAKNSLLSQLQSLSQTFHKNQKSYIKEFKKMSNAYDDLQQYQNFNEQNELLYQQEEQQHSSINMNKRNSDLKKIADTVVDLHTIFKELSVMLVDQGSLLDQIDYNMEASLDKSEKGINKLKIIEKRENDKIAKKCVSYLTTLIFVLLFLIIIKHLY